MIFRPKSEGHSTVGIKWNKCCVIGILLALGCLAIGLAVGLTIGLMGSKDDNSKDCMTVSGNNPNKPCIFPFTYKGKTYDTCILWEKGGDQRGVWCPTLVDEQGNYVEGNWGYCGTKCPITGTLLTITYPSA